MSDTRDRRTLREKLAEMARQERQSPNEAAIARRMLLDKEPEQALNPMLRAPRRKPKVRRYRVDEFGEMVWDDDE
jgi:hypothetical protein